MTHSLKALICLWIGSLTFCAGAAKVEKDDEGQATDPVQSDNPYQAIVERNVFGLKPPPPPPDPETQKAPPPKITLTGISTMLGRKVAFLKTPPAPVKPGEQSKGDQYYTVAEGVSDGPLEVLQIDEKHGVVKIKYDGQPSSLDFTNNGAKVVAAPAMPGVLPAGVPAGGIPAPPPTGMPAGGMTPMPTRTLRLPTPGGGTINPTTSSYQNPAGGLGNSATVNPAYGFQTRTAVTANTGADAAANAVRQMPVAQQYLMVETERERTRDAVSLGVMPPLPPTPLTPAGSPGSLTPAQTTPTPTPSPIQLPRPPGMPLPQ